MLNLVERYILRNAAVTFLAALVVLTAVIWLTQALREFDLLTMKGQSLLVFLGVTGLAIPSLVMVIAPIALFIAVLYTLNRLNGDSELIVLNAAGLSPVRLMRPFGVLTLAAVVLVGTMSLWAVPAGLRTLRDIVTHIRADMITRIVREGTFATLDQGFTFHYRERGPNGSLLGIFIQDRRDPAHVATYLAESGTTQQAGDDAYLLLRKGSLQREDAKTGDAAIVVFDSYQIDLTQFGGNAGAVPLRPRERSTPDLIAASPADPYVAAQLGRFRAELHDRLTSPLYALSFGMIGLAALAEVRSTRQGRARAILTAIVVVLLVRVAGFGALNLVPRFAGAIVLAYAVPLGSMAAAAWWMFGARVRVRPRRTGRLVAA